MCRIAYNPAPSTNFDEHDLLGFFRKLEDTAGKDGNGLYVIESEKWERYATRQMPDTNIKGAFMYHTRIGTKGNKAVYNNQPFVGKRYVLAHNGSTYKLDDMARLLGYRKPDRKYSDSHMAHYIVEKVGILHFWLAMKDSTAGVFLIYDKVLKKAFLCKFSGVFECARFTKSSKVIYASSSTDYWVVEDEISMSDGFYRLNEDGFDVLDKKRSYTYNKQQTHYHGRGWDDAQKAQNTYYGNLQKNKKKKKKKKVKKELKRSIKDLSEDGIWKDYPYCYYCSESFMNGQKTKIDWGFRVCEDCFDKHGDASGMETDAFGAEIIREEEEEDSEPVGMGALFADKAPSFCKKCKWLYKNNCWFGGDKRTRFPSDAEFSTAVCHTNNKDTRNVRVSCDTCNAYVDLNGEWEIYRETIVCRKCIVEIERQELDEFIEAECKTCKYESCDISKTPCVYCWREKIDDEKPPYWEQKIKCKTCMFFGTNAYPCKVCKNFNNWENESMDYGKCWYCGYHFDRVDEVIEDKKGHMVCDTCDDGIKDGILYSNNRNITDYQQYLRRVG